MEYTAPADVPRLISRWLRQINASFQRRRTIANAIKSYAKAHIGFGCIHPFFDGNGRMARLLANIPVLRLGFPPILIAPENRSEYISLLWHYQNALGHQERTANKEVSQKLLQKFIIFLRKQWLPTLEIVKSFRNQ